MKTLLLFFIVPKIVCYVQKLKPIILGDSVPDIKTVLRIWILDGLFNYKLVMMQSRVDANRFKASILLSCRKC